MAQWAVPNTSLLRNKGDFLTGANLNLWIGEAHGQRRAFIVNCKKEKRNVVSASPLFLFASLAYYLE